MFDNATTLSPGPAIAPKSIGVHIASRSYGGATDDSAKDQDAAGWIMELPSGVRDEWLATLRLVRGADRLLESETIHANDGKGDGWRELMAAWVRFRDGVPGASPHDLEFARVTRRCPGGGRDEARIAAWDGYFAGLWRHRSPTGRIRTIGDLCEAFDDLSGNLFLALPFRPVGHDPAIAALGMLDQLFNNIRDLGEDIRRGIRWLPDDLMVANGIQVDEFPNLLSHRDHRVERLHEELLDAVVPSLEDACEPLLRDRHIHASWALLVENVTRRHRRIEVVARECGFCADAFDAAYWRPLAQPG